MGGNAGTHLRDAALEVAKFAPDTAGGAHQNDAGSTWVKSDYD